MKKTSLLILIVFCFFTNGKAQNTYPWPTSGYIGVGTTSPGTQLEVHSPSGIFQNNIAAFVNPTTGSYSTFTGAGSGSTVPSWTNGSHILEFTANTGGKSIISSYNTPLFFQTSGSRLDRMVIDLNGNVGISKIDPQERLHIENGNIFLPSSNGNSGGLVGVQSGDGFTTNGVYMPHYGLKYASPADGTGVNLMASSYGGMRLYTEGYERLRMLGDGRIGIGTTTPGDLLTVAGNIRLLPLSNSQGIYARDAPEGGNPLFSLTRQGNDLAVNAFDGIGFTAAARTGVNTAYQMYVSTNGNVGIGSTNPFAKLTIQKNTQSVDPTITSTTVDNLMLLQTSYANNPSTINSTGYKWGIQFLGHNDGTYLDQIKTGAIYAVSEDGGSGFNRAVGLAFHTTAFDQANTEHLRISATGNVGINTPNPQAALDVAGKIQISGINSTTPPADLSYGLFPYGGVGLGIFSGATDVNQGIGFWTNPGGNKMEAMRIFTGGNVTIGTTNAHGYKLAVNGNIRTKEVNVTLIDWPDYVFKPNYPLKSLKEVQHFINTNHYLPDMPSAANVEKNGLNLGEINKTLTKKIEELTLYLIEKDRKDEEKQVQIDLLNKRLDELAKKINK